MPLPRIATLWLARVFNEVIYTFLRVQPMEQFWQGRSRALQVLRARRTRAGRSYKPVGSGVFLEAASAALMADDSRSHLAACIVGRNCCLDGYAWTSGNRS